MLHQAEAGQGDIVPVFITKIEVDQGFAPHDGHRD